MLVGMPRICVHVPQEIQGPILVLVPRDRNITTGIIVIYRGTHVGSRREEAHVQIRDKGSGVQIPTAALNSRSVNFHVRPFVDLQGNTASSAGPNLLVA